MGLAFSGEIQNWPCECDSQGVNPAGTGVPYVISLNNLQGLVTLAPDGGVSIRSEGNVLYIGANGTAGLGTVTTVNATSSNTNLVVTGGPVTTVGTFAFSLAGNLNSISAAVMAADTMLYATGAGTFTTTPLTAFARTLLDDAASSNARATLGLVIGTNVQAWNADLDSFVTNASWSGANLTLSGNINAVAGNFSSNVGVTGTLGVAGLATLNGGISTGSITAATISGDGSGLTALNATQLTTGTTAVARGGTGIASYAVGDLIYASGATTLSKLADVAAGAFLRSGGVTTAPAWSTTLWPNTLVTGDVLYASSTTQVSRLADVATGNVLISGGVGVAPSFGKVTSSHVDTATVATVSSGSNSNIGSFVNTVSFGDEVTFNAQIFVVAELNDSNGVPGNSGELLTSTGTGTDWSNQIFLDTLRIDTELGIEGTITAGGVTGNQTINKPSGTVNFAAGTGTGGLVVTNSLCTTSHRVQCTVCTNDSTAKSAAAVVTGGAFTIYLNANATAETAVYWDLIKVT